MTWTVYSDFDIVLSSKAETAMTLRLQNESYVLAAADMSTVAFMSEKGFLLESSRCLQ